MPKAYLNSFREYFTGRSTAGFGEAAFILAVALAISATPVSYNGFGYVRGAGGLLAAVIAAAVFHAFLEGAPVCKPQSSPNVKIAAIMAFIVTTFITLYQFTFREFYFDSAAQIPLGDLARSSRFMLSHARESGAGIPNPPVWAYFMGMTTAISHDPQVINFITTAVNLSASLAAIAYFAKNLPPVYAVAAMAFLAVNPAAVVYSNVLWEGSLIQPAAVFFNIKLHSFIARRRPRDFVWICAIAAFASQNHQSGFFMVPLCAVVWFWGRREIPFKTLIWAAAAALMICAPYIYYLTGEAGLKKIAEYAATPHSGFNWVLKYSEEPNAAEFKWQMLLFPLGMASDYYFNFIFAADFEKAVSYGAALPMRMVYLMSLVVTVLFAAGWTRYIAWVVLARRLFVPEGRVAEEFPIPFQIAGFIVTATLLMYLAIAKVLWLKHFIITFPCHALIAAWPVWRLWRFPAMRISAAAAVSSSLVSVLLFFTLIRSLGGGMYGGIHYYGLTYSSIAEISEAIKRLMPHGFKPQIYLAGTWLQPVEEVVYKDYTGKVNGYEPVAVNVSETDENGLRAASWSVRPITNDLWLHKRSLIEAVSMIPPSASAAGNNTLNTDRLGVMRSDCAEPPYPNTPWTLLQKRSGAVEYIDGGPKPDAEYILLDTTDPRLLFHYPNKWVGDLLLDPGYGLIYHNRGIMLFRRGAAKVEDYGLFFSRYNFISASEFQRNTGEDISGEDTRMQKVRFAEKGKSLQGLLAFGPYISLPPGNYKAVFKIKTGATSAYASPLHLDAALDGGRIIAAVSDLEFASEPRMVELPLSFTVEKQSKDVEFRLYYKGGADAWFYGVTLLRQK